MQVTTLLHMILQTTSARWLPTIILKHLIFWTITNTHVGVLSFYCFYALKLMAIKYLTEIREK